MHSSWIQISWLFNDQSALVYGEEMNGTRYEFIYKKDSGKGGFCQQPIALRSIFECFNFIPQLCGLFEV